jgi:hypothetical protein
MRDDAHSKKFFVSKSFVGNDLLSSSSKTHKIPLTWSVVQFHAGRSLSRETIVLFFLIEDKANNIELKGQSGQIISA